MAEGSEKGAGISKAFKVGIGISQCPFEALKAGTSFLYHGFLGLRQLSVEETLENREKAAMAFLKPNALQTSNLATSVLQNQE